MNMNALGSFETSRYVKLPATQRNIPEDQSPEDKCGLNFGYFIFRHPFFGGHTPITWHSSNTGCSFPAWPISADQTLQSVFIIHSRGNNHCVRLSSSKPPRQAANEATPASVGRRVELALIRKGGKQHPITWKPKEQNKIAFMKKLRSN